MAAASIRESSRWWRPYWPARIFSTARFAGPRDGTSPNAEFALTDLELASRLSFFLWNTGPDEELLTLAAAGGLTKPGAMEKQVQAHAGRPQGLQPGHQFCDEVAEPHHSRFRAARSEVVPGVQRTTAARFLEGSGRFHQQHPSRRPQRGGSPHLQPHVPE